MSPQQRKQLYDVMTPKAVEAGTELMRQGDEGDFAVVIQHGSCTVEVNGIRVGEVHAGACVCVSV